MAGTSTQTYHFTLPESAAGTRVPVCILKSDLTARSPYNSSELELIVPADIPEGKLDPVPVAASYPAAPVAEQDVSGKVFVAKQGADKVYPMFKIETATAVVVGDKLYVTVQVNPRRAALSPIPICTSARARISSRSSIRAASSVSPRA